MTAPRSIFHQPAKESEYDRTITAPRRSLGVARSMRALRLLLQPCRTGLRQRRGQGLGTMRSAEVEKTGRPGNIMPAITAARLYSLVASCRVVSMVPSYGSRY